MNDHIVKQLLEELAGNVDELAGAQVKMQDGVMRILERMDNIERRLGKLEAERLE